MKLNLNRLSGMIMLFCLGSAASMFVSSFLLRGHYHDLAGAICNLVGASLFTIALICWGINALEVKNGKDDPSNELHTKFILGINAFTILTLVVMMILGESIRFW